MSARMNSSTNLILIYILVFIEITTILGRPEGLERSGKLLKPWLPERLEISAKSLKPWRTNTQNLVEVKEHLREETGTEHNLRSTAPPLVPATVKASLSADVAASMKNFEEEHKARGSNTDELRLSTHTSMPIHHDQELRNKALPLEKLDDGKEQAGGAEMKHEGYDEITTMDSRNTATEMPNDRDLNLKGNTQRETHEMHGKKRAMRGTMKHKLNNRNLKHGEEISRKESRNIYRLNGFDGDKGTVRFVKKVSKPDMGHKEINWIIKIKQVVADSTDEDDEVEEEVDAKAGDMNDNLDEEVTEPNEIRKDDQKKNVIKASEKSLKLRHLMEINGKENLAGRNLEKKLATDSSEPVSDVSASNSDEDEADLAKNANPDSINSVSAMETPVKSPVTEDMNSATVDAIKKKVENGDMSFMLRHKLLNDNEDREQLQFLSDLKSNKKIDKQLEKVAKRFRSERKNKILGRTRNQNNVDDDRNRNDVDEADESKFNELIIDGENDAKLLQISPDSNFDKRDILDRSGSYGVSVDDENNTPNEYDTDIENGVKEIRIPRSTKQRLRVKRLAHVDQTTKASNQPEHGLQDKTIHHRNEVSAQATARGLLSETFMKNENEKKQRADKDGESYMNSNGDPKIIGVGYIIFNNDRNVKEGNHVGLMNSELNDAARDSGFNKNLERDHFPTIHRRPCNSTHRFKVGNQHGIESDFRSDQHRLHPCHGFHKKHHNTRIRTTEHHVVGRTENHQGDGFNFETQQSHEEQRVPQPEPHITSEQLNQKGDHEKISLDTFFHGNHDSLQMENRLSDNHNPKHVIGGGSQAESIRGQERGEMLIETYRRGRTHHEAHSGTAIHVLVVLSIVLICFTVILFMIVRNRSGSGQVREMNSRTALYVPQAKY